MNITTRRLPFALAFAVGALALVTPVRADEPTTRASHTREERLQLLEIEKAQLTLETAKADMDEAATELAETEKIFKEGLVTSDDMTKSVQKHRQAVLKHRSAEIDLEKKRLEFLKDATLVTVVDAIKYRGSEGDVIAGGEGQAVIGEEGDVIAEVTLRNDSDISKARIAMRGATDFSDASAL